MARVCEELFPATAKRKAGYMLDDTLKAQLDILIKNIVNDWDFTIIISGGGSVRTGKCLDSEVVIPVKENGKWVDRKIGSFKDGQKITVRSFDFENNCEVESQAEVIQEYNKEQFYKVTLDDGRSVECTMNHKLYVRRGHKIYGLPLKEIKIGDEIISSGIDFKYGK